MIHVGDYPVTNDNRAPVNYPDGWSDGTGQLNQQLDLLAIMPYYKAPIISGNIVTLHCAGPLKGETVIFKASYATPSGQITSNELKIVWSKDTKVLPP